MSHSVWIQILESEPATTCMYDMADMTGRGVRTTHHGTGVGTSVYLKIATSMGMWIVMSIARAEREITAGH